MNPEKEPEKKESPADALARIREKVREIGARTADIRRGIEDEDARIVKEIMEMAEGNKKLAKQTERLSKDPSSPNLKKPSLYDKIIAVSKADIIKTEGVLIELADEYKKTTQVIDSERKRLESTRSQTTDKDSIVGINEQLEELNALEKRSEETYADESNKIRIELEKLREIERKLPGKVAELIATQEGISRYPYQHATEKVLESKKYKAEKEGSEREEGHYGVGNIEEVLDSEAKYKTEEERGEALAKRKVGYYGVEDPDYYKKFSQERVTKIKEAVNEKVTANETYEEVKVELPKMEEYLAGVEKEFKGFGLQIEESQAKLEEACKLFLDTLKKESEDPEGIIKEKKDNVDFQRIRKNKLIKFGETPDSIISRETNDLQNLYNAKSKQIENISGDCTNVIVPIYDALTYGHKKLGNFTADTVMNAVPDFQLEKWKKMVEGNPDTFGNVKDRINKVLDSVESIKKRRIELISDYNELYSKRLPELLYKPKLPAGSEKKQVISLREKLNNVFSGYVRISS